MSDRDLIDRAQVARRLGHTVAWYYKHAPELLAQGFPEPVLGGGAGARWDPAAITDWMDRRRERNAPPLPPEPDAPPDLAAETAELNRRSAQLAERLPGRRRRA